MIQYFPTITGSLTVNGDLIVTGTGSMSASLALNSNLLQGTGSTGFATTASLTAVSSSQQQISASLLNVVANYATTGSNSFRADQSITGSLVVSSTITAQTLVVQTVTSSILYSSGSNLFGNALNNTQTFTGSVNITGSQTIFGNVGIGTSSPSGKLHIHGQSNYNDGIYVSNPGLNGASITLSSTDTGGSSFSIISTATSNTPGAGTLSIYDGIAYRFTIKSGSVGIGTTNPSEQLNLMGANAYTSKIRFTNGASNTGYYTNFGYNSDGNKVYLQIADGSTASTIMTWNYNSNVGIGTTNPSYTLDVTGTGRFTSNVYVNPAGPAFISMGASTSYGSISSGGSGLTFYMNGATRGGTTTASSNSGIIATDGDFYFTNGAVNSTRLFISSSGNIGISNTSPSYKLDIGGTSSATLALSSTDATSYSEVYFRRSSTTVMGYIGVGVNSTVTANGDDFIIQGSIAAGNIVFRTNISGTIAERVRINSSGNLVVSGVLNVGTQYNTPTALTINTDANWTFGCYSDASTQYWMQTRFYGDGADNRGFRVLNMNGNAVVFRVNSQGNYAFTGTNISDRRMKENINYVTSNQLATILKLKPASYNQIDTEGNINENTHTGFIAQDVLAENIPNLVMGSDKGGYGLDYNGVLALAVKAIQELKAEFDTYKETHP